VGELTHNELPKGHTFGGSVIFALDRELQASEFDKKKILLYIFLTFYFLLFPYLFIITFLSFPFFLFSHSNSLYTYSFNFSFLSFYFFLSNLR
jgi:hypothetical protein